jgi:hypothetical protein
VSDGRDPAEVERVRAELVRLGYLTSGVDRYLLDDLASRGGMFRRLLRGSARGALAAAGPVAIVLAALLLAANPTPGGRIADAAVLFLHLLPLAFLITFAALALFAGIAGGVASRLARDADPALLARVASGGVALSGAVLATVAFARLTTSVVSLVAGGVVTAAAAFLLQRIADDEALALLVTMRGVAPRRKRTRLLVLGGLVAGAVAGAALLALPGRDGPAGRRPAPPLVVAPPSVRVALVAVDGFDEGTAQHLVEKGELPELGRLMREGRRLGWSRPAGSPPSVWTTLWTGVSPRRHGIAEYEWVRPAGCGRVLARTAGLGLWFRGVLRPLGLASLGAATATERSAPALWEITSRAGRATLQIGNWGSGPAAKLLGRSVSNRVPVRLRRREPIAGEVAPAELAGRLTALSNGISAKLADPLWIDEWERRLFVGLWSEGRESFGALYLPALDLVRNPPGGEASESDLLERAEALREAYSGLDRLLAFLGSPEAGEATAVVLVGDSGREGKGGGRGVLFARGIDVGRSDVPVSPVDVLPTLLAALGIPLSDELEGKPVLAPGMVVSRVERYEAPAPLAVAGSAPIDAARYLQELRSLGYIQ